MLPPREATGVGDGVAVDLFVVASCRECGWELEPADATPREQRRQSREAKKHTDDAGHATVCGLRPVLPA